MEEFIENTPQHTGKCLNCGKELTDADRLQFNAFCSAEHHRAHIKEIIEEDIVQRTFRWENIDRYNIVKTATQLVDNIITLDKAVRSRNPIAIKLVEKGRNFVLYKIGNSEIRTAPSKFSGYVANTPEFHAYAKGGNNARNDYRNGNKTDAAISALNDLDQFTLLPPPQTFEQFAAIHTAYCKTLGTWPSPAFGNYGTIIFWKYIIQLPE